MTGPIPATAAQAPPADARQKLLAATRQLEAVFLEQMLQAMRRATPTEGGLFETSAGEEMFRGLFDETLARLAAAQSERGPGMAMYRQLSRHLPPEEAAGGSPLGTLERRHGVEP